MVARATLGGNELGAIAVGALLGLIGRAPGLWRKSQPIRLVDVFLLGPFMVWVGARARGIPMAARLALIAAGAATVVFNGLNWLQVRASADPGAS